jgi:hypothetical protein
VTYHTLKGPEICNRECGPHYKPAIEIIVIRHRDVLEMRRLCMNGLQRYFLPYASTLILSEEEKKQHMYVYFAMT